MSAGGEVSLYRRAYDSRTEVCLVLVTLRYGRRTESPCDCASTSARRLRRPGKIALLETSTGRSRRRRRVSSA